MVLFAVIINCYLMPTKTNIEIKPAAIQDDKPHWWEKYQSNAEKRDREEKEREVFLSSISEQDLKFLKEFGNINVSIAGIFALTKILKR